MQGMRFESQKIFIVEKNVQFCGKLIPKSKKKVRWVIKSGDETHCVTCTVSFYSGKKIATHNGFTIMNIEDSKDCLDCVVKIGQEKLMFMVDSKTQTVNLQRKFVVANDEFLSFKNLYSQQVGQVYEKYYRQACIQFD